MQKTIITLIAFVLSILAVAFTVFSQRTQTDREQITVTPNIDPQQEQELSRERFEQENTLQEQTTLSEDDKNAQQPSQEKTSAFHITPKDCANECENFTPNSAGWRYCATRCDIIPVQAVAIECDAKSGLSRDYCLRDAAIKDNNPSGCEEIADRGIAEQCTNKIIESLVDGF